MKSSEELFQLIQSLGKNEKRYFKTFSSRHVIGGRSTYLELFDAIGRQKTYDEEKIRKQFAGTKTGMNLAVEKNRLFNLLLKSLSVYHSEISIESRLREQIQRVEVLFEKRLFSAGMKVIQKAKAYAIEHESHLYLLELLRWEKRWIVYVQHTQDVEDQNRSIYRSECDWTDAYRRLIAILTLNSQMHAFANIKGILRKPNEMAKVKSITDKLTSITKDSALGRHERIQYTNTMLVYSRLTRDFEKAYAYIKEQEKAHRKKPADNRELNSYLGYLQNLFIAQMELGKYREAGHTLEKIKQFESNPLLQKSTRMRRLFLENQLMNQLELSIALGDFETGVQAITNVEKALNENWLHIGIAHQITFYWFFAHAHFGIGQFKTALRYLNEIINHPEQDVRVDLQVFARILTLIVHFELGNQLNLPHYIKSVYRYLLKKERMFKLETILLEFIRKKLVKINSSKELNIAFEDLKKDLARLEEDEHEREALKYFDIISWLESKIEGRSFAEVVREKAVSNS